MNHSLQRIAVLPGDGIGPEVIAAAEKICLHLAVRYGISLELKSYPAGGVSIDECGVPLRDEVLKACKESVAVLKGPFGGPAWDHLETRIRPESAILKLRKELDLFANLRPVKLFPSLLHASTLKPEVIRDIDILIVRELTSGLYFGEPRGLAVQNGERVGFNTLIYREHEVRRIMQKAFEFARLRRNQVHSVDKFNVLESSRLWHTVADESARDYPDVRLEHMLVDNCAMQLIANPSQFDVLVTTNMFGDILSDEASMLSGSLGMLPSASLGGTVGMYEPSHGSAPDIAGTGKANPLATILSVGMMFTYSLGCPEAETALHQAVHAVLEAGNRTADLREKGKRIVSTAEMTDLILKTLG